MTNREITFYSLLPSKDLAHIFRVADSMDHKTFIKSGYDKKWYGHLWIPENNECFLDRMRNKQQINIFKRIFEDQLKLYLSKHSIEIEKYRIECRDDNVSLSFFVLDIRKNWVNNTMFICNKEYQKTKNEIFAEIVKWCKDWQKVDFVFYEPYESDDEGDRILDIKEPIQENYKKKDLLHQDKSNHITSAPLPVNVSFLSNDLTKYESEFFRLNENIYYESLENYVLDIHSINQLLDNVKEFKAEINENITRLTKVDRDFYLNRVLKRLNEIKGVTILKRRTDGHEYPYLYSKYECMTDSEKKKLLHGNYMKFSDKCKNQMIDFIFQLIGPTELVNNRNWHSFRDRLNMKFKSKGVAVLNRHYTKGRFNISFDNHLPLRRPLSGKPPIFQVRTVAFGITAYLSHGDSYSYRYLISSGSSAESPIDFYQKYFDHCMRYIREDEVNKKLVNDEIKSESELIYSHLKKEEYYFNESDFYYSELRCDAEKKVNGTIKEVALYYPKWVKETYLKDFIDIPEKEFSSVQLTIENHELIDNQKKSLTPEDLKKESEVKEFIMQSIDAIDNNRKWHYVFKSETDYKAFLFLLTNFCLKRTYILPEEIILNKDCKTRFAPVFNTIYKKYRETKLSKDEEYFKIIKVFNHFKTLTNRQIYKDITREKELI